MMSCRDCIHYDVCKNIVNRNYSGDDICTDVENYCKHFKDKSKIIELPCKVGDLIYRICGKKGKRYVAERRISSIKIYEGGISIYTDVPNILGKTVFLTREEAEKALKETNDG